MTEKKFYELNSTDSLLKLKLFIELQKWRFRELKHWQSCCNIPGTTLFANQRVPLRFEEVTVTNRTILKY